MKVITGKVVSLKNAKTAKVEVTRKWQHPMYKKSVTRSKSYACHYENMDLAEGDTVAIRLTVPKSKTKRFEVVEKV